MLRWPMLVALTIAWTSLPASVFAEPSYQPLLAESRGIASRIAISGDGGLVLSAAMNADIAVLWDVRSGRPIHSLRADLPTSARGLTSMDLTPDGRFVATGHKKVACLWDTATGRCLQTFKQVDMSSVYVSLSADGRWLATGGGEKGILLWDCATGGRAKSFGKRGFKNDLLTLSADGKRLLTTVRDGYDGPITVFVWDVETGEPLRTVKAEEEIRHMAVSANGQRLLMAGKKDPTPVLWNLETGDILRSYPRMGEMSGLVLSADGKRIVTYHDDVAVLWDADTGKSLHTFVGHENVDRTEFLAHLFIRMGCLAITADGARVVAGMGGPLAKVWDAESGRLVQSLEAKATPIDGLALAAEGERAFSLVGRQMVVVRDTATGERLKSIELDSHTDEIHTTADGKRFLTDGPRDIGLLWETETGRSVQVYGKKGRNYIAVLGRLAMSADGSRMLTPYTDETADVREVATDKKIRTLKTERSIDCSAFDRDGKLLVTSGGGRDNLLWDLSKEEKPLRLTEFLRLDCLAFSPDAKYVAGGTGGGGFLLPDDLYAGLLWDTATGKQLQTFMGHTGSLTGLAFSADGKQLYTSSVDGTVVAWETGSGKTIRTFAGHRDAVSALALTSDDKWLWTMGEDATVRIWNTATGEEIGALQEFSGGKEWLFVSPSGHFDGSPAARANMAWRETGTLQVVASDALREKFYQPGLLKSRLRGETPK